MQERARVIAGPDDVVRLELEHIGFFPAKADLMAPLVELSVALEPSCSTGPTPRDTRGCRVANWEPPTLENARAMPVRAYVGAISSWHVEQTAGSA